MAEEKFVLYFFEVWDKLEDAARKRDEDVQVKPAYFRFLTLLSFHAFMQEGVDVALYEVGVGGQFDSTNIITKPLVTGITSLDIDHVQVLGKTIEEIAWHKAGIFKAGSPAYSVWQPAKAMDVLRQRAKEQGLSLTVVPIAKCLDEVQVEPNEEFQKRNASLAIVLAAHVLERLDFFRADPRDHEKLEPDADGVVDLERTLPELFKAGLTRVVWRGRGEIIDKSYGRWFLDGAHTEASLEIVSNWFGKTVQQSTAEHGGKALCVIVFNQQASTRDARRLIETVQKTLRQKWNLVPQELICCSNITYKTRMYKPGELILISVPE